MTVQCATGIENRAKIKGLEDWQKRQNGDLQELKKDVREIKEAISTIKVELPLPKAAEDGGEKTASAPTSIPWRTKAEIDAEREAAIAAEQERTERRARIKAALNDNLLESSEADLRDVLRDMAMEMGLIN